MSSPSFRSLFPLSAISAGIVAVLIGFGSTIVLVVQAHQAKGASQLQIASGATALCVGMAIGGAALSLWLRMPVVLAWSSASAALLASSEIHPGYPAAIGAFMAAAALMLLVGLVPLFGRLACFGFSFRRKKSLEISDSFLVGRIADCLPVRNR